MTKAALDDRLAVCSWSLQPENPEDLLAKIKAAGLRQTQLALDPLRESPAAWGETEKKLRANQIAVVSGMFGCVGEDYSSMDRIRATGGLAPDATWKENRKNMEATADLASALGMKLVTFHAGFLPHEESDPSFGKMLDRLAAAADIFERRRITLALETGQETAAALASFLRMLRRPNVGVNFDPANMILYNNGDPLEGLRALGPWLRQIHIKDAVRTKTPGAWGEEVPVGAGEVDWQRFLSILAEVGFAGHLVIEREAGNQRLDDVRTARTILEKELCRNET